MARKRSLRLEEDEIKYAGLATGFGQTLLTNHFMPPRGAFMLNIVSGFGLYFVSSFVDVSRKTEVAVTGYGMGAVVGGILGGIYKGLPP
jgi:hypothetical protein